MSDVLAGCFAFCLNLQIFVVSSCETLVRLFLWTGFPINSTLFTFLYCEKMCVGSDRKREVLAWVNEGIRDFSISRAAVEWGIPVPKDPEQTVYVWFDALSGSPTQQNLLSRLILNIFDYLSKSNKNGRWMCRIPFWNAPQLCRSFTQ